VGWFNTTGDVYHPISVGPCSITVRRSETKQERKEVKKDDKIVKIVRSNSAKRRMITRRE
jgi:hypothetical protein